MTTISRPLSALLILMLYYSAVRIYLLLPVLPGLQRAQNSLINIDKVSVLLAGPCVIDAAKNQASLLDEQTCCFIKNKFGFSDNTLGIYSSAVHI